MKPRVDIEVDSQTGVWTTDNLPMIYMPRHFFLNFHNAMESIVDEKVYRNTLYGSGHKSTSEWCESTAKTYALDAVSILRLYLERISDRGWGRFKLVSIDEHTGRAEIELEHSIFVLGQKNKEESACYPFAGWFAGGMDWVGSEQKLNYRTYCHESECVAAGHEKCRFVISPLSSD
jgi:predicted hydrocarbon binding protein